MTSVTSVELNLLVFRYFQESGIFLFLHPFLSIITIFLGVYAFRPARSLFYCSFAVPEM